jgi:hypothetical protein
MIDNNSDDKLTYVAGILPMVILRTISNKKDYVIQQIGLQNLSPYHMQISAIPKI